MTGNRLSRGMDDLRTALGRDLGWGHSTHVAFVVAILIASSLGFGLAANHANLHAPQDGSSSGSALHATEFSQSDSAHDSGPTPRATAPAHPTSAGASTSSVLESGKGIFFNNSAVQNVTTNFGSCSNNPYYGYDTCWNATLDPTLNVTRDGYTGLAYTVWTNFTPCFSLDRNASTEIQFEVSHDFGSTWTTPIVLGNPTCKTDSEGDQNYSSAEMPALTSLANGTFVLAYIESNVSASVFNPLNGNDYYYSYPLNLGCYYTDDERVVVSESYNHGTTWTTPHTLQQTDINYSTNSDCRVPGLELVSPSIAAIGTTVYLAYTDYTSPYDDAYNTGSPYNGTIHLWVSNDSGASWRSASVPPTFSVPSSQSNISAYPNLLVLPSGKLFMSYSTGDSWNYLCSGVYCGGLDNASLVVAWSSDNGTSFSFSIVSQAVYVETWSSYWPQYVQGPYSQLAYSGHYDQLYITYASEEYGCYIYYPGGTCETPYYEPSNVFVANSSDGGTTWSAPNMIDPGALNPNMGPADSAFLPSISASTDGTLVATFTLVNDSVCGYLGGSRSPSCGYYEEWYANSTDNGTSWSAPALVDANTSYGGGQWWPGEGAMYVGTSSAAATNGSEVLLVWPRLDTQFFSYGGGPAGGYPCVSWGYCGAMNVEISKLYLGAGYTVSFSEKGLPPGVDWSLTVAGYYRSGPSFTALSISGVPPSYPLLYNVNWVNTSYGSAWSPNSTPPSPAVFPTGGTISVNFSEQFLVNIEAVPTLNSWVWNQVEVNYEISPLLGQYWVQGSSPLSLFVNATPPFTGFVWQNVSWQAWVGTGSGSYSGTAQNATIYPTGPVNETATFTYLGYCLGVYYGSGGCVNNTFNQLFVPSGLPDGTPWAVTINESGGSQLIINSTAPVAAVNLTMGESTYTAWTIPSATPGKYWVPAISGPTAFSEPNSPIAINYTLESIAGLAVGSLVDETGLPANTNWSFQIGTVNSAVTGNSTEINSISGVREPLNASGIYYENGTGFYLSYVSVDPLVMNATAFDLAPGNLTTIDGPAVITYHFRPWYLMTLESGAGGSISLPSQWAASGSTLNVTATPAAGYHFVCWTGSGLFGSVSTNTQASITVTSLGPLSELATFRVNPAETWNVTVLTTGLPSGTDFTVRLGTTTYTTQGELIVGNLTTGNYSIGAPTVRSGSTSTTQYVASGISEGSGGPVVSSLNLSGNVTLTVGYTTQYSVTLATTTGGWISDYPSGTYWEDAGSTLSLTAVSAPGFQFVGWSGSDSSQLSVLGVTVNAAANETADFQSLPTGPSPVFSLTVTESGLPPGMSWIVTAGATGSSGATAELTVPNLNGTYPVTAPTLYPGPGTRWVSSLTNFSTAVTSNRSISVYYWEQFQVTVSASPGGTATDTATAGWANASSIVTLTATPNSGSLLVAWNGTGVGSYSGNETSLAITVTGPITEQATFTLSVAPTKESAAPAQFGATALGIVIALLVVGVVGGFLWGRRARRPPSPPPVKSENSPDEPEATEAVASAQPEPAGE